MIIDNYDSFTYNLEQLIGSIIDDEIIVVRNDKIDLEEIKKINPNIIIISPGPGNPMNPDDFGICNQILLQISQYIPTLGICLGHQGIASSYGSNIVAANSIVHGKKSLIYYTKDELFNELPNPFSAARYHSLIIDEKSLPQELQIIAKSDDGEIMAIKHRIYPIFGLQFHPESILTKQGEAVMRNFINIAMALITT